MRLLTSETCLKHWGFQTLRHTCENVSLAYFIRSVVVPRARDVLPAVIPFSNTKIYGSLNALENKENPLDCEDSLKGLGLTKDCAIVLVFSTRQDCRKHLFNIELLLADSKD